MSLKCLSINGKSVLRWLNVSILLASFGIPANADMFKPGKSDQIRMGEQAAKDVLREKKLATGPKADALQRISTKLLENLPDKQKKDWKWNFYLIQSKEVNAFALPGGSIFVYTGLTDKMDNDNQMAAVVGHEMAHVYKEHWANMVADATKRELGLAIILGLTKAGSTWQTIAGGIDTLMILSYSRKDEDQADESGLLNMCRAGFDTTGMVQLFEILKKAGGDASSIELLRSHPDTKARIKKTQERIEKLKKSTDCTLGVSK